MTHKRHIKRSARGRRTGRIARNKVIRRLSTQNRRIHLTDFVTLKPRHRESRPGFPIRLIIRPRAHDPYSIYLIFVNVPIKAKLPSFLLLKRVLTGVSWWIRIYFLINGWHSFRFDSFSSVKHTQTIVIASSNNMRIYIRSDYLLK